MNVSLPLSLREWVDQVVVTGGYGTASEYVRELIRDDQRRRLQGDVDREIRREVDRVGREAGTDAMNAARWDEIRNEVLERVAARWTGRGGENPGAGTVGGPGVGEPKE